VGTSIDSDYCRSVRRVILQRRPFNPVSDSHRASARQDDVGGSDGREVRGMIHLGSSIVSMLGCLMNALGALIGS
jgi:hypothetical protein